jgi:hypothetical protein
MSNNTHIVVRANEIVTVGVEALPTKKLVEDYNVMAELAGSKPVKKFASRAKAEERVLKMANEVAETFNYLLEESKEVLEGVEVKTPKTRKGLTVTIDGTVFKYSELKVSLLKGATEVVIGEGATEKQVEWINSSRAPSNRGGKISLMVDIDGKPFKYSQLTATLLKNGKDIKVTGEPTEKQVEWLSKYGVEF